MSHLRNPWASWLRPMMLYMVAVYATICSMARWKSPKSANASLMVRNWLLVALAAASSLAAGSEEEVATAPAPAAAEAEAAQTPEPESPPEPYVIDLDSAQEAAIRDNPSLHAAAMRIEIARALVMQARGAFFPQIEATYGLTKTWTDEHRLGELRKQATWAPFQGKVAQALGGTPVVQLQPFGSALSAYRTRNAVADSFTTYAASLSAKWLLFNGFAREVTYAAQKFGAQQAEAGLLEARRMMLSAVAGSYYAAALARENVRIAQADEGFNARLLKEAKARREAGMGSLSDELNFEVAANGARATRINAESAYRQSMIALAELMGVPEGRFSEHVTLAPLEQVDAETLDMPDAEVLLDYALARRPDLESAEIAERRAIVIARARWGLFSPEVMLSVERSAYVEDHAGIHGEDWGNSVGLKMTLPLFTGGQRWGRLQEKQREKREARYNVHSAEIAVAADVHGALEQLESAREQLKLQRTNAGLVRQNRDLVEKEYSAGQASLVRLNEAQRDLISAEARLALARVSLLQAWEDLDAVTGKIIEPYDELE